MYQAGQLGQINGKPSVYFNNSAYLKSTAPSDYFYIFIVAKFDLVSVTNYQALVTGTSNYPFMMGNNGTANWYTSEWPTGWDGVYCDGVLNASIVPQKWHLYYASWTQALTTPGFQLGLDRGNRRDGSGGTGRYQWAAWYSGRCDTHRQGFLPGLGQWTAAGRGRRGLSRDG